MERKLSYVVSILAVLTAAFVGADISSFSNSSKLSSDHQVINCTGVKCEADNIDRRYVPQSCNQWGPWSPPSKLECNWTKEGVRQVTLVTDVGNYITSPKASAEYETTYYEPVVQKPWDLEFLPDGRMVYTGRTDGLYIRDGKTDGDVEKVANFDVKTTLETGVLGLAVDPEFQKNNYIYVFYTPQFKNPDNLNKDPGAQLVKNRISRFKLEGKRLENERILIDNITGSGMFSGGRLEFGPDDKLYASLGDAGPPGFDTVDTLQALNGKTLRLNRNGTIPHDNPFNKSYVYSKGHRNPQGLAWNPETEVLYTSEHGNNRHDEINRVLPGEDYSWPQYTCGEKNPVYSGSITRGELENKPFRCFRNWTMAPSGMTFVDNPGHPWYGDLFIAGLRGNHIHRMTVEDGKMANEEIFFINRNSSMSQRLRDIEFWNNSLYVIGDQKGLAKLTFK